MGDTDNARPQGRGLLEATGSGDCTNLSTTRPPSATNGFWSNAEWIACRDGKSRPVEPGIAPLVNGATNRVGRLRGYGNAICAPVAEEFIRAYLES
jgi:DNA (cytosine-5)-methyltransferase 1